MFYIIVINIIHFPTLEEVSLSEQELKNTSNTRNVIILLPL